MNLEHPSSSRSVLGSEVALCSQCYQLVALRDSVLQNVCLTKKDPTKGQIQQYHNTHPFDAFAKLLQENPRFPLPNSSSPQDGLAKLKKFFSSRSRAIDCIFKMGDSMRLNSFTTHTAIRYLDLLVAKTIERDECTGEIGLSSSPRTRLSMPGQDRRHSSHFDNFRRGSHTFVQRGSLLEKPSLWKLSELERQIPLIATTCLLIGAKFNEPDENLPRIKELIESCRGSKFSWSQVVQAERESLDKLEWNVNVTTPLSFIRYMTTFGIVFWDDTRDDGDMSEDIGNQVGKYVAVFIDLAAYYPQLSLRFTDLQISIACVVCARKKYGIYPNCSERLWDLYASQNIDREHVQQAAVFLWEKYEKINHKRRQSTLIGEQIQQEEGSSQKERRKKVAHPDIPRPKRAESQSKPAALRADERAEQMHKRRVQNYKLSNPAVKHVRAEVNFESNTIVKEETQVRVKSAKKSPQVELCKTNNYYQKVKVQRNKHMKTHRVKGYEKRASHVKTVKASPVKKLCKKKKVKSRQPSQRSSFREIPLAHTASLRNLNDERKRYKSRKVDSLRDSYKKEAFDKVKEEILTRQTESNKKCHMNMSRISEESCHKPQTRSERKPLTRRKPCDGLKPFSKLLKTSLVQDKYRQAMKNTKDSHRMNKSNRMSVCSSAQGLQGLQTTRANRDRNNSINPKEGFSSKLEKDGDKCTFSFSQWQRNLRRKHTVTTKSNSSPSSSEARVLSSRKSKPRLIVNQWVA